MSTINIYIIHGYTANSTANWFPDLKENLESENIKVHIFDMPNSQAPIFEEWIEFLKKKIDTIHSNSIFIGHSLGCVTLLNFLEEKNYKNVNSLFLVSGFVEKTPIQKLSGFMEKTIDYSKVINNVKNRFVISAFDDDIIPYSYSEYLAEKIDAKFILLKKSKHFIDRDGFYKFPLLIDLINETIEK